MPEIDKDNQEKICRVCNKAAAGILEALETIKLPPVLKMAILGGCLAEALKELPKDQQLGAFIHHLMAMRSACEFENDVGVLPVAMEQEKEDGLTDQEHGATRH